MTKAILFDGDGVVLKHHGEYFSERFAREHQAPIEEVRHFFNNEFGECQEGKRDLREELAIRLPTWGWQEGIEPFLQYWFSHDATRNEEVLAKVDDIKKRVPCYLATDQEKYRAAYLLENLKLKDYFDACFFSWEMGCKKSNPQFFQKVIKRLDCLPNEIMYFDDVEKNIIAAKSLGIDAYLYTSIADLDIIMF